MQDPPLPTVEASKIFHGDEEGARSTHCTNTTVIINDHFFEPEVNPNTSCLLKTNASALVVVDSANLRLLELPPSVSRAHRRFS